jgi:hypothetical protein
MRIWVVLVLTIQLFNYHELADDKQKHSVYFSHFQYMVQS